MDQKDQKKLASAIVLKAREECRVKRIDPYIAVGAFIDETIRELSKVMLESPEVAVTFFNKTCEAPLEAAPIVTPTLYLKSL